MRDADLIACVYPRTDVHQRTSKATEASSRYVAPRLLSPAVQYSRRERESTEPPEPPGQSNAPTYHYMARLEPRFSDIPRTSRGIVFGCGPDCDVTLPDLQGISYHHFTITFDDAKRLIIRDWGSLAGTEVTYDDQGGGLRSNFQWIISGADIPSQSTSIIITVHKTVSFQIVVAQQDIESQAYIDKVDCFSRGVATAEDLLDDLNFPDRTTKRPTGAHTPASEPIHLRKWLGEGGFGVVTHFWNVSDGSEYALKEPTAKAIQRRKFDVSAWVKEARIMGQISHDHIVELFGHSLAPHPKLYLEYMPGGSLDGQENISENESLSILCQCLSALTYLHGQEPPVVHRDIKPGNILVQHRLAGDISIKFGDFGLSRESHDLTSICGTVEYTAPEIYLRYQYMNSGGRERMSYTPVVDVWSLGVVIYELMCDLPQYKSSYQGGGETWCRKVVEIFEKDREQRKRPDKLRQFLLGAIVVMSPESRWSAMDCYDQAMLLPRATEDGCRTPTPAAYSDEEGQTTFFSPDNHVAGNQRTVLQQPRSSDDNLSNVSIDTARYIRSGAPPVPALPSASKTGQKRMAAKRSSHPSSSASSAGRRTKRREIHNNHQRVSASSPPAELKHFLRDYSQNPLNSLYVGSSLALEELPSALRNVSRTRILSRKAAKRSLRKSYVLTEKW
ncbi:kinase [Hirsutella rhossiliensis]|uniref:non-specific serine/threonine protein kinase n=1 Tax=Hirsutella rhossiliensis TaxID=111463 RepID=A0A9P8MSZ4_9HYPO|nr:kinase [Hirsutella rhossiliensis]KAH0961588.1 kinase [Hirsutella rhossiliensis]